MKFTQNLPFKASKLNKDAYLSIRIRSDLKRGLNDLVEGKNINRSQFIEDLIEKSIERGFST